MPPAQPIGQPSGKKIVIHTPRTVEFTGRDGGPSTRRPLQGVTFVVVYGGGELPMAAHASEMVTSIRNPNRVVIQTNHGDGTASRDVLDHVEQVTTRGGSRDDVHPVAPSRARPGAVAMPPPVVPPLARRAILGFDPLDEGDYLGYDALHEYDYLGADAAKTPLDDDPGFVIPPLAPSSPVAAAAASAVTAAARTTGQPVPTSFAIQSALSREPALTIGPTFVPSDLPPRYDESKSPVSIFLRDDLVHGVPNAAVVGGGVVGAGLLYALYRALTKRSV